MRLIDAELIQYEPMLSAKGNGMYEDVMVAYKSQIDDLPTIEERKTGKWVQDNPFTKPRCSECGEPCFGLHGFDFTLTPYCPNCGSEMRRHDEGTADDI